MKIYIEQNKCINSFYIRVFITCLHRIYINEVSMYRQKCISFYLYIVSHVPIYCSERINKVKLNHRRMIYYMYMVEHNYICD